MARGGSRVRGATALRRTLRRLPPEMNAELGDEMNVIARRLLGRSKAEVPVRTGLLRSLLSAKVLTKSLTLRLGLVTRAAQRRGFYGYILDQGRRSQVARARRVNKKTGSVSRYTMHIRGIGRGRYDFVFGRLRDFRMNDLPRLRDVLTRVLRQAATGGGDD